MSDILHLKARLTLCRLLAGDGRGGWTAYAPAEGPSWQPDPEADREAAIEALVAIAAIDAREASEWRAVVRQLDDAPGADVGRLGGRAELLLRQAEDAIRAAPKDDKEHQGMAAWWLAEALREAGVLSDEDQTDWIGRLEEAEGIAPDDDDMGPRGAQFNAVLRVVGPPSERIDGVRLTSIELCDDGIIVRWHYSLPEAETRETFGWDDDPDLPHDLMPTLEDDSGTQYHNAGAGYGGGDGQGWGNWKFEGRVPEDARLLRLARGETRWEIGLG